MKFRKVDIFYGRSCRTRVQTPLLHTHCFARDVVMTAMRIEEENAIPIPDVPHKLFTLVLVRDYAKDRILLGEKLRGTF